MAFEVKQLGNHERLEMDIDFTIKEYIGDKQFQDITNLAAKLDKLKRLFVKHNCTSSGEIDYIAFHSMARELGVFTTVAELKQRVQEITGSARNVVCFKDCAMAMLGCRSTMCQRVMLYSGNYDLEKRTCWLDCPPVYMHKVEFTLPCNRHSPITFWPPPPTPPPSSLQSPITLLPPPPPPSPADLGPGDNVKSYPAA